MNNQPSSTLPFQDRLVKERERAHLTQISRSQCYKLSKQGKFPAAVRLSERSIAWKLSDLVAWIESRQ